MVRPCAPTTRSGRGNTRSNRTVEPAPRASAATTGTMPSLCSRPSIGVRIRFAIVARLRRVVISALLGRRRRGQRFRRTRGRNFENPFARRAHHTLQMQRLMLLLLVLLILVLGGLEVVASHRARGSAARAREIGRAHV